MFQTTGEALQLRGLSLPAKTRPAKYVVRDNAFKDRDLPKSVKVTFYALVERADSAGNVYPISQVALAAMLDRAPRTIREHLTLIVDGGYASIRKERVPGTNWHRNIYRINLEALTEDQWRKIASGGKSPHILLSDSLKKEPIEERKEGAEPPPPPPEAPIDWKPGPTDEAFARSKGLTEAQVAQEARDFIAWYRERPHIRVPSIARAWCKWIDKLCQFAEMDGKPLRPPTCPSEALRARTVWVSQIDARFPALKARYCQERGRPSMPIDKRGGWEFPKEWMLCPNRASG